MNYGHYEFKSIAEAKAFESFLHLFGDFYCGVDKLVEKAVNIAKNAAYIKDNEIHFDSINPHRDIWVELFDGEIDEYWRNQL